MGNNWYLLLVEDDPMVQANNRKLLERRGYNVKQAFSLVEARAIIADEAPHAIILDIQLPDGSGLDLLREVRATSTVPVLMLTAKSTLEDEIKGLEAGGDRYLPKPYELKAFLSNLEALLRRASMTPEAQVHGPFRLEPASSTAYCDGKNLMLSQKEFALLQQFIQHIDEVTGVEYLYEKIWGQILNNDVGAIKTQVSKLRKKLEGSGYTITSFRREGYCFEQE